MSPVTWDPLAHIIFRHPWGWHTPLLEIMYINTNATPRIYFHCEGCYIHVSRPLHSVGISLKELGRSGRSDVKVFEILHRNWNLKQIFTQKRESVDVNWGGWTRVVNETYNAETETIPIRHRVSRRRLQPCVEPPPPLPAIPTLPHHNDLRRRRPTAIFWHLPVGSDDHYEMSGQIQ